MTRRQRQLARNALGMPNRRRRSYRNYYLAACAPGPYDEWLRMVDAGMAEQGPGINGCRAFWLTRAGAEAALEPGETLCPEDFPG
jgi:hypothetical protein